MFEQWRAEEVGNQVRFRKQNEAVPLGTHTDGETSRYVCECGDARCTQPVHLTPGEYEAIRAEGRRFLVAPDHEDPEVERVIAECARYTAVETLPGPYGRLAMAADPRL